MLNFLRLQPYGNQQVGGVYNTDLSRREYACRNGAEENLEISIDGPFALEYDDCAEAAQNRSQCCGSGDDEFKDIGLDSTVCYSFRDDPNFEKRSSQNLGPCLSQRAFSHYDECENVAPERKGTRYGEKGPGRTAKSHHNFNDTEEDEYMNYDEDFEKIISDEVGANGFLELGRRQKSLRVSFADSDIKRPDQCRPRLRRNFDQINFNNRSIQDLLKTPGAAPT